MLPRIRCRKNVASATSATNLFDVSGYIFEKLSGFDTFDALQMDLAWPIGMQDFDRTLLKKEAVDASVAATVSKYPANPVSLSTTRSSAGSTVIS